MRPVISWIVVADAAQARVLVNDGPSHGLTVERELTHETLPSREIDSDRPGRTNDSHGQFRHPLAPPTDPARDRKYRFAREIIRTLDDARKQNAFERVYLVAPPQLLGDLREAMTAELRKMVAGEMNKDLTKVPVRDLPSFLGKLLPV
jgi:protein required for attachment to host cells